MRLSFADQIKGDIDEIRETAENEAKTQISQYQLSMQETLRQKQRELDKELKEIFERCEETHASMDETLHKSKQTFEDWQILYNNRMREMDSALENIRQHNREMAIENDERISGFRQNLEDIRKEIGTQKKMIDQTNEEKQKLEHSMEEINADLNRLEQHKNELAQMENQFTRIKRLEDEVNNKMTRFINEKSRIEQMQNDFDRILRTRQSVEEGLKQVTDTDDILQTVQLKIRKLDELIGETEEKYQRIERKTEVIEETGEGIDRNFKALQKTENDIKNAEGNINALFAQYDSLSSSLEALAAKKEKATDAAEKDKAADATEKIATLNESLALIEKRIEEMNVAREWLARTETELNNMDNDIKFTLKHMKSLLEKDGGRIQGDSGAPPPQHRDNVLRLKQKGFSIDEIASAMKLSKGEVELILEIASRE
jgi:chromosome segregation ATPase